MLTTMKHRERLSQFNLAMIVGLVVLIVLASVACSSEKQTELQAIKEYRHMVSAWLQIAEHSHLWHGDDEEYANRALQAVLGNIDVPTQETPCEETTYPFDCWSEFDRHHNLLRTTYNTHWKAKELDKVSTVEAQKRHNRLSDDGLLISCFNISQEPSYWYSHEAWHDSDYLRLCEVVNGAHGAFWASKILYMYWLRDSPPNPPYPNSITSETSLSDYIEKALPAEAHGHKEFSDAELLVWENVMDELVRSLAKMMTEYFQY